MSRSGDEMMLELYQLLNKQGLVSTAAKKEDDKEEKKEDKKDDKELPPFMKKKDDKKEDKKDDKKKAKAAVVMNVLQELTKLAAELDEAGADDASSVVDEALRVIVRDLAKETE